MTGVSAPIRDPLEDGAAPPALEAWLEANVAGYRGPATLDKISGGQSNPTYRATAPSGRYVLRRKPLGETLPSAHAVDREFRVLKALAATDVPVPPVHALCEDHTVAGQMFYVMDMVPGRVFWDPRLPDLSGQERAGIFASMNETIAAIHRLDPAAVGLDDFGKHGGYLERQINRWTRQYRASETEPNAAMERLIEWLPQNRPAEGETRLVHGDYRLDNVLIHPTEPKIVAVLDWELSTLGDPRADFAYHAMTWRFAPDLFRGLEGADLAALSIPAEEAYVARYAERSGFDPRADWTFFLALSMFRIAAIVQGIAKRALDGTAANADAAEVGAKCRPIAERACQIIEHAG
ncbi:phosphotransferase family protein [Acuticoccus sp. I52.16.1]|uniref:phosphotransferase family protein n=1 Tax=Acuticoccus sp. I52.16.1 TaxID=2928472 RepID=UPI001FD61657|nr:phosphotransferase family protein [Acuticoccus sp. I52.16.1]UOM35338.1 phosphotransferase family protein [Acuticoccus sp. I52.16.1]